MDKVLIHMQVPAIGQSFDVYIPTFLSIAEITKLLIKALHDFSERHYVSSGSEVLCHVERNLLLEPDGTPEYYRIKNGDHIILI